MRYAQVEEGIVTWIFYSDTVPEMPDTYPVDNTVQLDWNYLEGVFVPSRAIKDAQIELINSACAAEIVSGIYSEADGTYRRYDSDVVDQLNFLQAMTMAQVTSTAIPYRVWKGDGSGKEWITLTYPQFCQILADGATIKSALLQKCSAKKDLIENALTVNEIHAVTW